MCIKRALITRALHIAAGLAAKADAPQGNLIEQNARITLPFCRTQRIRFEQHGEDRQKESKEFGKDFICRLQSIFPSPAPTADSSKLSKLNTEEALLWSQSLEKLLQSKYGLPVFQTFLRSEFSEENIEFWLTCEDFKKIKSTSKQASRAKKIYEQFIQAESPREINIDHHTREAIRLNVQEPTMSCFDQAQKIVYGLMERDSYPRFLRSEIYLTLSGKIQPNQVKG